MGTLYRYFLPGCPPTRDSQNRQHRTIIFREQHLYIVLRVTRGVLVSLHSISLLEAINIEELDSVVMSYLSTEEDDILKARLFNFSTLAEPVLSDTVICRRGVTRFNRCRSERLFPMAWLNLGDWRTAKGTEISDNVLSPLFLSLFSLLNITAVVDLIQSVYPSQLRCSPFTRDSMANSPTKSVISATRYQQDSSAIQQQVNQVSQILTLELSNLTGLNIDRAHWTSSQLSLSGTYHARLS